MSSSCFVARFASAGSRCETSIVASYRSISQTCHRPVCGLASNSRPVSSYTVLAHEVGENLVLQSWAYPYRVQGTKHGMLIADSLASTPPTSSKAAKPTAKHSKGCGHLFSAALCVIVSMKFRASKTVNPMAVCSFMSHWRAADKGTETLRHVCPAPWSTQGCFYRLGSIPQVSLS